MFVSKTYDRLRATFLNSLIVLVTLAGTAYCFWADSDANKSLSAVASEASLTQNATELVRIDSIQVGTRVWAENPEGKYDHSLGDSVDSSNWKHIYLDYPTPDGSSASVELLRPDWWLRESNATPDSRIYVSIPECGIDGDAFVLDIKPCPSIPSGPGSVVTGKFQHRAPSTVEVQLVESNDAIECTGNHPIWSEDRQRFVPVGSLAEGEHLRCGVGVESLVTVSGIIELPSPSSVYNIEVLGQHVYKVGTLGVLVHNGCSSFLPRTGNGPFGFPTGGTGAPTPNGLVGFSGTNRPWRNGATPNSRYTYTDSTGHAIQNGIYDSNGNVIAHVDFRNHGPGSLSGHGHTFPAPGNPASGHHGAAPTIPHSQVPPDWIQLPPGIPPKQPIGT